VLDVTADIPSEEAILRWVAEPIKAITISTRLFLTNKKGYPVLSKPHQTLIRRLFKVTWKNILRTNLQSLGFDLRYACVCHTNKSDVLCLSYEAIFSKSGSCSRLS
jgi:protein arginine N-methyltransferase 5